MKKILYTTILLFLSSVLFAQQTYSIKILDAATSKSLSNASAILTETKAGMPADENGLVQFKAKAGQTVEVTMSGYKSATITLGSKTSINIFMESNTTDLADVVVLGSRSGGRSKTETAVPVDVIKINQAGQTTGRMDLTSVLNQVAPSFNYNKQTGSDGADHIDLGTLRGLGPDQTLVLINGKRRHQTAFVALFGTRGRGNSGVDLNAFPQSAVDRIEILRDGASAQYGSDAMAGVMNIMLKKDINKWNIQTGWSGYYDDKYNPYRNRSANEYYSGRPIDGGTFNFSANTGWALNKHGGFINISADYLTQAKTYRQVLDTNVATNKMALPLNTSRRAFGDGSVTTIGTMFNMELPTSSSKNTIVYAFGGYNNKASDAYAYTRNYSARPDRFPIDAAGNLVFDPSIMRVSESGEIYYNPHIQTKINDISLSTGVKGKCGNNWNWDISNTLGKNDFHFFGDKTFNASMIITPGTVRQNHFDDGGFNFLQNTFNVDLSHPIAGIGQSFNLGMGAEFRYEEYNIYQGEEASYKQYPNTFGQASGSQGFPGFSPADEVKANRKNISAYVDGELKTLDALLLDAAVRFENYSDFGSVATFKLASRYKITPDFNLRGSVSTGFRAPSLQQINFSNTVTSFYGGVLVNSRIARNDDAITKAAGIEKLKQETSVNSSIGFAWKPLKNMSVTVDGYMVQVKDRIVLSGLFDKDDATLPAALTTALTNLDVQTAQFFANSVNTTNFGVDILVDYTKKVGKNTIKALLAGNIQSMKVNSVNVPNALNDSYRHRKTFFSDREEAMLLASAPQMKWNLTLDYLMGNWTVGTHLNYFGQMKTLGFGWTGLASAAGTGGPGDPSISGSFTGIDPYVDIDGYSDGVNVLKEEFIYGGKLTTDIYASYKFGKKVTLFWGLDNLFNVHPDFAAVSRARYQSFDNESGGAWEPVQMGYNGRRLFGKMVFSF